MFYEKATRKTLSCLLAYFNRVWCEWERVSASDDVRWAREQNQSAGEHLQFDGMEHNVCEL